MMIWGSNIRYSMMVHRFRNFYRDVYRSKRIYESRVYWKITGRRSDV